ncbi:MAG: hypothetical protein S4CHLAM45_02000 [Chlamydiales bacterium]|nr:hypothetical protein [Chlamydiales bacterium]MCH9620337.1 hypothetical protein [Chlamydiales bacterium]MCH9622323.1 hypothetical protein [Chlamydiales bacterium]
MFGLHWIIQVFIVVTITLVADLIQKKIFSRLLKKDHKPWNTVFLESASAPLSLMIWSISLTFCASMFQSEASIPILSAIPTIRKMSGIAAIGWFLYRLISNGEKRLPQKKSDRATAKTISQVLRASVLITSSLVALQSLGFSISGVLAFGGIGGIAIGFAAKDMLANFFGAIMIFWDRPFKVGDWVRSEDKEIEGYVEEIGWRLTKIRSFEKRPIYLPNSIFSTISVTNVTRMTHRRIKEVIGVRYEDAHKVSLITAEIEKMLVEHPGIDESQFLVVNFQEFGDSALNILIYTFTHATGWKEHLNVKQEILLKIYGIIHSHDADIAFPTQTLHLPEGKELLQEKVSKLTLSAKK